MHNEEARLFCARQPDNERPDWPCESRVAFSVRAFVMHGDEPRCHACKRTIAITWGIAGDVLVSEDGTVRPSPQDVRNAVSPPRP